jgi:hypothetical protein
VLRRIARHALDALVEHKRETASWQRLIADEVLRRMDAAARWTIHAGMLKLWAPSPAPSLEYDARGLHDALAWLAEQGRFGREAVERAVEPVVTFKVHAGALKALAKLGPGVQAVIDQHTSAVERTRSVSVGRP